MKEKYKLRRRLKYTYTRCDTLKLNGYGEFVIGKSNRSWLKEHGSKLHRKDKQVISTKPSTYFEVHFSETKNRGELRGKKGYYYKIHTILIFSYKNPVPFYNYSSEEALRKALGGFGEIVKITRVTNMHPLVF